MSIFGIASVIVPFFSQCETAGGLSRLSVWGRGAWTIVNGRQTQGPRVQRTPSPVGNVAPLSQKDIDTFAEGKLREGDIWIFTNEELLIADEASQETGELLLHKGDWYRIDVADDWHYAGGYRYVGRRERGESGV